MQPEQLPPEREPPQPELLWEPVPLPGQGQLPERERQIVYMRFGLNGVPELTQKEVALKLGISQSYISRLEKRIMSRLKKEMLKQTSCA